MEIGGLLHDPKALDGCRRSNNPTHAQSWKGNLCKTIDVNDDIRTVELFQRWHALVAGVQPGVNMIFDDGHLMTSGEFQNSATRRQRHRGSGRVLKIRRENNQ